jgi:5-methylcytosine-specific restriction endonuclease McrA
MTKGRATTPTSGSPSAKKKAPIPSALREQIWIRMVGKAFESKCPIPWCQNTITVFDFQAGHNIPESKGGKTVVENLVPICARCNLSMGDRYTIDEWKKLGKAPAASQQKEVPIAPSPKSFCCWSL